MISNLSCCTSILAPAVEGVAVRPEAGAGITAAARGADCAGAGGAAAGAEYAGVGCTTALGENPAASGEAGVVGAGGIIGTGRRTCPPFAGGAPENMLLSAAVAAAAAAGVAVGIAPAGRSRW